MGRFRIDLAEALTNLRIATVERTIDTVLEEELARGRRLCTCNVCLVDIGAVALNALPAQYVTDPWLKFPGGPDQERAEHQRVLEAVRKAVDTIASRPHHDR